MVGRGWQTISDPGSALRTRIRINPNGSMEEEYHQTNMTEILEVNMALKNADRRTTSLWNGREHAHVARIPEELITKWMREGINFYRWNDEDKARVMKKLNDGGYNKLRTAGGVI